MEQASKLAGKVLTRSPADLRSATGNALTRRHIAALWARMGTMFGRVWEQNFPEPESAIEYWFGTLNDERVTPEQIAMAFQSVRDSGEQYPPTLPRFLALCKARHQQREDAQMYREFPKALPAPRGDAGKARAALDKMRAAIKAGKVGG